MEIQHYSKETREHLRATVAREDPLEPGKFLLPANTTPLPLPDVGENEAALFDKGADDWEVVPDFRGEKYYSTADQTEMEMALGEMPGADVTDIAPTDPDEAWAVDHWEIPFAKLAKSKQSSINVEYNKATEALLSGYPQTERDTFWKQETEARAYKADAAAVTPYLDGAAVGRAISKVDLVDKIILKADVFSQAVGELTGKRQRLRDAVLKATKAADLDAISW